MTIMMGNGKIDDEAGNASSMVFAVRNREDIFSIKRKALLVQDAVF